MEKVKHPKAIWDSAYHSIYMDVCVEEVRANNRAPGNTSLSDVGQANLLTKFILNLQLAFVFILDMKLSEITKY